MEGDFAVGEAGALIGEGGVDEGVVGGVDQAVVAEVAVDPGGGGDTQQVAGVDLGVVVGVDDAVEVGVAFVGVFDGDVGTGQEALGYLTGDEFNALHGSYSFNSVTLASNDVAIKYTYKGDANLDGLVNADDYAQIDAGYLLGFASPTWVNGDFNHDGMVNASDYALIDAAFSNQGAGLADGEIALHTAMFGDSYVTALTAALAPVATPEPASLALLGLGALALLKRRR